MRQEITKLEDNVTNLSEVNKELLDYIEALETEEAAQTCTGKKILQVGPKQRGRKLRLLKIKSNVPFGFLKALV